MTKTHKVTVDGKPLNVRDLDDDRDRPHGWRPTSRGFALVGVEPTSADDPLGFPLDFTDKTASRLSTVAYFNKSVFDMIRVLDQCRRYEFVSLQSPGDFRLVAGPYEVQTFIPQPETRAKPRYRIRCACGETSKWYLSGNRRHLMRFHSTHRCLK